MILHPKYKDNILKSLVMMDKYNLQCLQPWFAHNKKKKPWKILCSAIAGRLLPD